MIDDYSEGRDGGRLPFLFLWIVVVETVFLLIVESIILPVSSKSSD